MEVNRIKTIAVGIGATAATVFASPTIKTALHTESSAAMRYELLKTSSGLLGKKPEPMKALIANLEALIESLTGNKKSDVSESLSELIFTKSKMPVTAKLKQKITKLVEQRPNNIPAKEEQLASKTLWLKF